MKRRRGLHFGSVGFAGLGRAIIKNNSLQTTKHRSRIVYTTKKKAENKECDESSQRHVSEIRKHLQREGKTRTYEIITLLIVGILILLVLFYVID